MNKKNNINFLMYRYYLIVIKNEDYLFFEKVI